jgi:hypothetical protein
MTNTALLSRGLAALLLAWLPAMAAQALDLQTFVSSTGGGSACTRAAPCAGFQAAHDAMVAGGEIKCLDSGIMFGFITDISKSTTIDCDGGTISAAFSVRAAGVIVRIRNTTFNRVSSALFYAIDFQNGAALFVENCVIADFNAFTGAAGIRFAPSSPAQLIVTDTVLSNSGSGSTGGGMLVNPQPGGSARVVLNRVTVEKNVFGIAVDGSSSTGGINMTIADSVLAGNVNDGVVATTPSGGAPIGVYVKNTKSANNGFGIRSLGPNVTVRVDGSSVIGNVTGLSFSGGGALQSYGNNNVDANATNGAFSGSIAMK